MKESIIKLIDRVSALVDVKSLVTLSMTVTLIAMLVGAFSPAEEFKALYCTSYGCIITYFFTKEDKG